MLTGMKEALDRIAASLGYDKHRTGGYVEVTVSGYSIVIRIHDALEARRIADTLAAGLCRRATGEDKRPCMYPQYHSGNCQPTIRSVR